MTNYHESMRCDDRNLNGLGVLAAVRSGNFAVAGRSLHMSKSGVGSAIARLELRLVVRLLERRLYEQIVPLLAGVEEAAASVAISKDAVGGTLRVNCAINRGFSDSLAPGVNSKKKARGR
jgi:DNA-binding transcriptional LysR family regulator